VRSFAACRFEYERNHWLRHGHQSHALPSCWPNHKFVGQAGARLYVARLSRSARLTSPLPIGRQKLYEESEVGALVSRKPVTRPYPPAYVVRVLAKAKAEDGSRAYQGFTAGHYDPSEPAKDDEHRRLALAGWWPCPDPDAQVVIHSSRPSRCSSFPATASPARGAATMDE
jgi:hypothetical protein